MCLPADCCRLPGCCCLWNKSSAVPVLLVFCAAGWTQQLGLQCWWWAACVCFTAVCVVILLHLGLLHLGLLPIFSLKGVQRGRCASGCVGAAGWQCIKNIPHGCLILGSAALLPGRSKTACMGCGRRRNAHPFVYKTSMTKARCVCCGTQGCLGVSGGQDGGVCTGLVSLGEILKEWWQAGQHMHKCVVHVLQYALYLQWVRRHGVLLCKWAGRVRVFVPGGCRLCH